MKKWWKFEFSTYFHKSSQINPEAFQDQKNSILMQKTMIFKSNGAKHSPSSLPLDWPSADFWGPRAGLWLWPFDPILLMDILHRSINPQTYFENYLWALISLNISSNEPRKGLLWTGNVSQKMWKNNENLNFWRIFINHPRSTQKHSKIKKTTF